MQWRSLAVSNPSRRPALTERHHPPAEPDVVSDERTSRQVSLRPAIPCRTPAPLRVPTCRDESACVPMDQSFDARSATLTAVSTHSGRRGQIGPVSRTAQCRRVGRGAFHESTATPTRTCSTLRRHPSSCASLVCRSTHHSAACQAGSWVSAVVQVPSGSSEPCRRSRPMLPAITNVISSLPMVCQWQKATQTMPYPRDRREGEASIQALGIRLALPANLTPNQHEHRESMLVSLQVRGMR